MDSDVSRRVDTRGGHPLLRILASFPVACFSCALLTDITYVETTDVTWVDFSTWLLAVGMAGGVLGAIVGVVSLIAGRHRGGAPRSKLILILGSVLTLGLALLNNLVHSRDAWTSVMPEGLALSAVIVVVMIATAWLGSRAGVRPPVVAPYSGARS